MTYKNTQYDRQSKLIGTAPALFSNDPGNGVFRKKRRDFALSKGINNLFDPIRHKAIQYFKENRISWWGGYQPTNHMLSSQIACVNHLFAIKDDPEAVLSLANSLRPGLSFARVIPIDIDKTPGYISFEVVSSKDWLNEGEPTRGANCTSVDALIIAEKDNGERWLIPIEWKYTEVYALHNNKSRQAGKGEPKDSNSVGETRLSRYSDLITASDYLKSMPEYLDSIYFYEPFYQLMRQTLWAEQIIKHSSEEWVKADHFLHIHVIPSENKDLLDMKYLTTGKGMEESWRGQLQQDIYQIITPEKFLSPIKEKENYTELIKYLSTRYW